MNCVAPVVQLVPVAGPPSSPSGGVEPSPSGGGCDPASCPPPEDPASSPGGGEANPDGVDEPHATARSAARVASAEGGSGKRRRDIAPNAGARSDLAPCPSHSGELCEQSRRDRRANRNSRRN